MKKNYSLLFLLLPLFMFSQHTDLMISKYGEGSSNHKFLEIYNGTGSDIDLSTYAFPNSNNAPDVVGAYDYWNSFTAGAVIAAGDVYVISHPSADDVIEAQSDQHHTYLSNGDDGFKLVKDFTWNDADNDGNIDQGEMSGFTVVDVLGDWQADPGSGWDVAGVSNATKDHTLTRKTSVCSGNTDWASSAGTTTEDSEWVVTGQNEGWDTVGSYTTTCSSSTTESIPWSDDFETGDLSNWTNSEATGAPTSIWEASSLQNNTSGGGYSARHNYSSSGTFDSYLVGPTFDLSGATSPVVSYSDYVDWTSDADTHSLVYSEDYTDDVDAATWVVLNDVLGSEDTWVANGPYALPTTGTVTIAFRYQGYYAAEWFVDDVSVAEAPAGASADWDVSVSGSDATISMTVNNFTIGATGDGYDGHWHYTLDGGSTVMLYDTNDVVLTGLSDGEHTLVAWLVDDNHAALDPAVEETITFWTFSNDECSGAIAISDGEQISGDTTNATNEASDTQNFPSNDLWYSYTGNGQQDDVTISLCGSSYDTYLRIFDACGGSVVAYNDDSCSLQSEVTFTSDGTSTYIIKVEGYSTANGAFTLAASSTLGIGDVELSDLKIYPNPVDGNYVTILSPVNGTKYIEVFDIMGRRVMDTTTNGDTLDVSSINSGYYMIKVTIDGQSKISKLIVR